MGKSLIIKGADFSANKIVEGRGIQLEIKKRQFWYAKNVGDTARLSSSPQFNYIDKTPCQQGDVFTITGLGGAGSSRLWAFLDIKDSVLSIAEAGENVIDKVLIAPQLAKSFIATGSTQSDFIVFKK